MLKYDYGYYFIIVSMCILTLAFKSPALIGLSSLISGILICIKNKDVKKLMKDPEFKGKYSNRKRNIRKVNIDLKLDQMFNAIPSPLVYFNKEGNIEISNIYFSQMVSGVYINVYDKSIDYTIRNLLIEASINRNKFIRRINYNSIDYQVHAIPIISNDSYVGSILVFQDVTQIVEGENMQKRFISDASHELRTPITSIMGMVEILNRAGFNDLETQKEFLFQIENDVKNLDLIVKDLLLQSKMREKKLYLDKVIFDLEQLFENIIHDLRADLIKAKIKVRLQCEGNITIFADQFRLSQVFINLINNSINYAENGIIDILCESTETQVIITISDNGKGIKEENLPHVFERFYRGESDRRRKVGGSGLGLAISKSIIDAHDGTIEVISKENIGTTFIIKLTQS